MPRRARLSLPGIPWHIIQRGNKRAVCFHGEEGHWRRPDELTKPVARFGCPVRADWVAHRHEELS
jgi:putative transposase